MKYSDLEKQFYILAPIKREKKVYVCKDKTNLFYEFFYETSSGVEKVDSAMEKELRKIYKPNKTDIMPIFITNELKSKYPTCDYVNYFKKINQCLPIIFNNLDENKIKKIQEHLSVIKCVPIIHNEQVSENIRAYFDANNNVIALGNLVDNELSNLHIVLHETLHACSSNNFCRIGVEIYNALRNNNDKKDLYLISASTFNETLTEIICQTTIKQFKNQFAENRDLVYHPCNGYNFAVSIVLPLLKYMDYDKVKELYFNNDLEHLVDYIANCFHIEDSTTIFQFIHSLDALQSVICSFYDLDAKQFYKKDSYISDIGVFFEECEKHICNMIYSKYKNENCADFKSLDVNHIFRTPSDVNILTPVFENSLKNIAYYIELLKFNNLQIGDTKINGDEAQKYAILNILNKSYEGLSCFPQIPEKMKKPELFYSLFQNKNVAINTQTQIIDTTFFENLFKTIFNPANDYLPRDEEQRKEFILYFIRVKHTFKYNILKYLPKDTIGQIINSSPKLGVDLMESCFVTVINSTEFINANIKKSDKFLDKIKLYSSFLDEEKAFKIFKKYFISFTMQENADKFWQDKLTQAAKTVLSNKEPTFYFDNFNEIIKQTQNKFDDVYNAFVKE